MGATRATDSAQTLIAGGAQALVSWGCAAGLAPDLGAGALILPTAVVHADGREYWVDDDWRARLLAALAVSNRPGHLLSVHQPCLAAAAKADLYRRTQALGLDMETAAIAAVAHASSVAFLAVRAVVDRADMDVPPAVLAALGPAGRLRPVALSGALLRAPADIAALWRLRRAFNQARATLAEVGRRAGPRLAAP